MAEIIGRIGTPVTSSRNSSGGAEPSNHDSEDKNRSEVFTFRFVENHGKAGSPKRTATWYDVRARLPPQHAETLQVGQVVKIRGRLKPEAYVKTDLLEGEPVPETWSQVRALLDTGNALAISNLLLTTSVVPCRLPVD